MEIHYHHIGVIWALFLVGEGLHVFLQVDDLARKNLQSRIAVLKCILAPVAYRAFACAMIFGLLWQHPDIVSRLAGYFGHPLSADESEVFAIPMNNSIAGLYGLFLDSLLGYIPVLKSQLPALNVTQTKQTTTLTQTIVETKQP